MSEVDKELHGTVESIVNDLEAAASGFLYNVKGDYEFAMSSVVV